MASIDRRLTPARPDLAASHLRGSVEAERYVDGSVHQVCVGHCNLHAAPRRDDGLETQLHLGQSFTVYDEQEGWAWGQASFDGYVGYVPSNALAQPSAETTHRVSALRSFVYPAASMKMTPTDILSMNAEVAVLAEQDGYAETQIGFVFARHLQPKSDFQPSVVDTALKYVGVPYLWGGRTSLGIDCSGLVQEAFLSTGMNVPRDTDQQENAIGRRINLDNSLAGLEKGDLVFWDRHVGIMVDPTHLIHANAYHMYVEVEPLSDAVERIKTVEGPVTSIRRWQPAS